MKGTTTSGFEFEIDDRILTDWRFVSELTNLKDLEDSDSKEIDFIGSMKNIEKLIFKDNGKAFEKHIASQNDGAVPTDVLLKELLEIIKSKAETKNS